MPAETLWRAAKKERSNRLPGRKATSEAPVIAPALPIERVLPIVRALHVRVAGISEERQDVPAPTAIWPAPIASVIEA
jgi:hypothetical protein